MPTLAIRCEFLLGVYQASDPFGAPDTPEWPPHPFRLHAALCASAAERGGSAPGPDAVEALHWLEEQGPPTITYSLAVQRSSAQVFVPRNPVPVEFTRARDAHRKSGRFTSPWLRNGRSFPTSVPHTPTVVFRWETPGAAPPALSDLVDGVSWLGSSRSPVALALADGDPSDCKTITSDPVGPHIVRVAASGTTDQLLAARHTWPAPAAGLTTAYSAAAEAPPDTPESPYGQIAIRALQLPLLDVRSTAIVTTALRTACLSRGGDDAPAALHGHGGSAERCAYLALPDVGHPHATGLIRGVALAIPAGLSIDDRAACLRAFSAVNPLHLGNGARAVRLEDGPTSLATLTPERWSGPAERFATVTPIVLDHYPKKNRSIEAILQEGLVFAGYPEAKGIQVEPGPPVAAAPLAGHLRGDMPPGVRVHATFTFATAISGPLLVGRGRFRGLGLCMPRPAWRDDD